MRSVKISRRASLLSSRQLQRFHFLGRKIFVPGTKAGTGRNLEDSTVCAAGSGMDLSSENPGEIYRLLRYINDMRDQLSAEADGMHP